MTRFSNQLARFQASEDGAMTAGGLIFTVIFLAVGGLAVKSALSALGLVVAALCVTGVLVWRTKRLARRNARRTGRVP